MPCHELHLLVEVDFVSMSLHCLHGADEMPWCGNYDEYGHLVDDAPTGTCWAKEWADNDGVYVGQRGLEWKNPRFPWPVVCWFDGDSLRIDPIPDARVVTP